MKTTTLERALEDPLLQLERKIAQRADELSRRHGFDRGHALNHWRQAEREVWGRDLPVAGIVDVDQSFASLASPF